MFFIYEWTFYFIYYELYFDIHTQAYCQRNDANATQKHYRLLRSSIFLLPFVFTASIIIGHVLNLYSELSIFQTLEQLQFFFYTRLWSSKYQRLFASCQIQRAIYVLYYNFHGYWRKFLRSYVASNICGEYKHNLHMFLLSSKASFHPALRFIFMGSNFRSHRKYRRKMVWILVYLNLINRYANAIISTITKIIFVTAIIYGIRVQNFRNGALV